MTEDQDLTFSQLCRVHAAIGVPIVLGPDTLRRYAALMDEHEARCSEFIERGRERLERASALRDEALWWTKVSVVAAVTGVLVNIGLIWWLG